jgi:HD-GYP domain-containing protein (c-di-GMP phosphodiesterase class II)
VSAAGLTGRGQARKKDTLEALYSPDAIQPGTTSPGAPGPGPAWDARLRGLVTALETRVPGAAAHGRRVAERSLLIGRRLGVAGPELERLDWAARAHDVGKIIVSPEILEKPGPLTNCEYEEVKRHAVFGSRLVDSLHDPELTAIVRHHHERLDGSGYPDRLRGAEIPLGARIIAVADTFDALTSCRPYRQAHPDGMAIEIIVEESGTTFDAEVVAAFVA